MPASALPVVLEGTGPLNAAIEDRGSEIADALGTVGGVRLRGSTVESEVLLDTVGEDELPRNVYFGDGSPIPDEELDAVRAVLAAEKVTFPWQAGDVLMLDNMLIMHGREPYAGPRRVVVAMAEAHGTSLAA